MSPPEFALRFEQLLTETEGQAVRMAEGMVKSFYGFSALPRRDDTGTMRHGHGRPIERRPISLVQADRHLREEMVATRHALHARVFTLMAKRSIPVHKLAALYAIADIIDVEKVRDWHALWRSMELGEWNKVVRELLRCDIDRVFGATERAKDMFADLVMVMVSDAAPEEMAS